MSAPPICEASWNLVTEVAQIEDPRGLFLGGGLGQGRDVAELGADGDMAAAADALEAPGACPSSKLGPTTDATSLPTLQPGQDGHL
jgi:hypothetical protein